jgi:hypothetical protein
VDRGVDALELVGMDLHLKDEAVKTEGLAPEGASVS